MDQGLLGISIINFGSLHFCFLNLSQTLQLLTCFSVSFDVCGQNILDLALALHFSKF